MTYWVIEVDLLDNSIFLLLKTGNTSRTNIILLVQLIIKLSSYIIGLI